MNDRETMSDTPRTDAILTELAVVKETDFAHIVLMTQRFADFTRSLERELAAEKAKVEMLRIALTECAEDMEDWGGFASDYFKKKWNLQGDISKYAKALEKIK